MPFLIICLINLIFVFVIFFKEQANLKRALGWECIVGGFPIIGFIAYLICSNFFVTNKIGLEKMATEGEIYNRINSIDSDVNSKNYTFNNNIQIFQNFDDYFTEILASIEGANTYILLTLNKLPDYEHFKMLVDLLIQKKRAGVVVKLSYEHCSKDIKKLLKELQEEHIRPIKFSKIKTLSSRFQIDKTSIIIDGTIGFISSVDMKKSDSALFFALQGDILYSLDYNAHRDYSFASKKFLPMISGAKKLEKRTKAKLVTSFASTNYEFELISHFARAKKSIKIMSDDFIVSDRILHSLLTAMDLEVKVQIMVSKKGSKLNFYASKYYMKKLCEQGAECYVYDGKLRGTTITIDDEVVIISSTKMYEKDMEYRIIEGVFAFDNSLNSVIQNRFNDNINNSYKMSKFRVNVIENFSRFVLPLL